jgi:hypothetical protein
MEYTVTMRNEVSADEEGRGWVFEATDTVSAEDLDAYVADAKTRWSEVTYQEK